MKNKSAKNILNNNAPRIEPWDTPKRTDSQNGMN